MPAEPPSDKPPGTPGLLGCWQCLVLTFFGTAVLLATLRLFIPLWENSGRPDAALLVLTSAASIAALAKHLPAVNVLLAAGIAAGLGGIAHAINNVTGLPFGKFDFTAALGPRLLGILPFAILAIWGIAALTSRGVARLALHRFRPHPLHGFHVLGLSVALMVVFQLMLEPLAVGRKGWWTQNPTPLLALVGWALLSAVVQIAITPLLLDKFPKPRPPNFFPLLVWLGIHLWMIAALLGRIR